MYTQVVCPRCQTPYTAEIHQVVDVSQSPELKYRLLNGQLNVAVCPNCGAAVQLATPLLFHDPEYEMFMIYVPVEMNMNQMQREQLIGQLTRQVMDKTPPEKRRAYMLQPQMILNMQTFMEKVLETEGITPEMIARQRRQAELLQTLAKADKDVADYLIKERLSEIDENFFAMLQSMIETGSQMNDDKQLLPLINLRARLMTETPAGRQLEKQQVAFHALNQEAKKQGGLTPALLLKHLLANQEDEKVVDNLVAVGQAALSYEFFSLLTEEVEKQEKAGNRAAAQRLTALRERLLQAYNTMQQQSRQLMEGANETLETILAAPDKEAAIRENLDKIDDVFMYFLSARIAQADQRGQTAEAQALNHIHSLLVKQVEEQIPPEIRLLNELLEAEEEGERQQLLDENQPLISPALLRMVEAVEGQLQEAEQPELNGRLQVVKGLIEARLARQALQG
jgi:hypothetical protein